MKTKFTTWNTPLLIELLVSLFGIGIGVFGIWYDSAVTVCIILIAFSAVCALILLFTQYLCVRYDESGLSLVYLLGTLGGDYATLPEVVASNLFSAPLPLFTYYTLDLSCKKGRRYAFMDSEIVKSHRNKYALLAGGVRIRDERDDTLNGVEVPAEVRRAEHRMRDTAIKAARAEGAVAPKFGYEVHGLFLPMRPTRSYHYVAKTDDAVTPLLAVKKRGKAYTTKEL